MALKAITGATGFLGSHMLWKLLQAEDDHVICMGRDKSPDILRTRIADALKTVARSYPSSPTIADMLARCEVVLINLHEANLGLSPAQREQLGRRGIGEFWHFAASLLFEEKARAEIELTNVGGVENVLRFCKEVNVPHIVHISTAFVNGARTGRVGAVVNDTGKFNNTYEETKQRGELLVIESGLRYTILRPSIIIGNSTTYDAGGAKTGFYAFAREMKRIARLAARQRGRVRVKVEFDAEINMVPVDQFVTDCLDQARADGAHNRICNLSASHSCNMRELEACLPALDVHNVEFVDELQEPTPLEEIVGIRLQFFGHYITNAELRLVRTPSVTAGATIEDLQHFSRLIGRQREDGALGRLRSLIVEDGRRLAYRGTLTDAPAVVLIVNAYGLPVSFWDLVVKELEPRYDVIAVEFPQTDRRSLEADFVRDARQIAELANAFNKPVHLVSWCSGCGLALAASSRIKRLQTCTYFGAGFNVADKPFEDRAYATITRRFYARAASSRAAARNIYEAMFKKMKSAEAAPADGMRADIGFIISCMNPRYLDWATAMFENLSTFENFACKLNSLYNSPINLTDAPVTTPSLFIVGEADQNVDRRVSEFICSRLPRGELMVLPDADHWALHSDVRIARMVGQFADRHPA